MCFEMRWKSPESLAARTVFLSTAESPHIQSHTGEKAHWTTAHPHCGGSGVQARPSSRLHWNKTCALGSTGLEKGEDWGRLACPCVRARPHRREEHLRKLGRLAASVSELILPHICHWSSSAHMFLEKEAAKGVLYADQVKAVCIYSNALLFTVWLLLYLAMHV